MALGQGLGRDGETGFKSNQETAPGRHTQAPGQAPQTGRLSRYGPGDATASASDPPPPKKPTVHELQKYDKTKSYRQRIEEAFGWGKTVGTATKTMLRGTARVGFQITLNMVACNFARLPKLLNALHQ